MPLLDTLVSAALDAGAAILEIYARGIHVETKGDGSPVTEADRAAEALILTALRKAAPEIPIVAEEEAAAGRIPMVCRQFFLVDPLDGTREFLARNGEYTVNIALIEDGCPVTGVVYAPALNRLFAGERGNAWQADVAAGRLGPSRALTVRSTPLAPVAVASRSHRTAETERWLEQHGICHFVSKGSSLKFCLLAAGEADLYPRFERTMEWDTAAGDAVLRAAGGCMVTPAGSPFVYGKRNQPTDEDFANGAFVAVGDPKLLRIFGLRVN